MQANPRCTCWAVARPSLCQLPPQAASTHSIHSVQVSSPRSTLGSGQAHSGSNTYLNLHKILTQPKDFALPTLGPKLAAIKQEIVSGRGFKLIR